MTENEFARRLERLEARVAICELKARYFRAVDMQDWDLLESVFDREVTLVGGDTTEHGVRAVMARIRENIEGRRLLHHGHMPEIVVHDDGTASGVWAMEDLVETSPSEWFHGFGHYHETYRLGEKGWCIRSMTLVRLFDI